MSKDRARFLSDNPAEQEFFRVLFSCFVGRYQEHQKSVSYQVHVHVHTSDIITSWCLRYSTDHCRFAHSSFGVRGEARPNNSETQTPRTLVLTETAKEEEERRESNSTLSRNGKTVPNAFRNTGMCVHGLAYP